MDTISSDNNESFSYLPILALIVGLIAGVLGGVALAKVSNINQSLSEQSAVADRVDALETELRKTSTSAEQATARINKVASETNAAFKQFSDAFGELRTSVEEMHASPTPVQTTSTSSSEGDSSGASAAPATAAGQYTVKGGDTGSKIARDAGISLNALLNANPGVNWNRLSVGQALNIPGN
ncbi:LysM peptidoglycan-binding domain-containing protein [Opitutaceae bacterium]|nr:LysM peptidoglycan-binding domain-containing protein [Opitutaceae bacterium]MDB4473648.1 LysM peptidoglycan-binding domain-containing protein [Opitutaceae bacterium]